MNRSKRFLKHFAIFFFSSTFFAIVFLFSEELLPGQRNIVFPKQIFTCHSLNTNLVKAPIFYTEIASQPLKVSDKIVTIDNSNPFHALFSFSDWKSFFPSVVSTFLGAFFGALLGFLSAVIVNRIFEKRNEKSKLVHLANRRLVTIKLIIYEINHNKSSLLNIKESLNIQRVIDFVLLFDVWNATSPKVLEYIQNYETASNLITLYDNLRLVASGLHNYNSLSLSDRNSLWIALDKRKPKLLSLIDQTLDSIPAVVDAIINEIKQYGCDINRFE